MSIFKFAPEEALTPEAIYSQLDAAASGTDGAVKARGIKDKKKEMPAELADQFFVFQITNTESGQTIQEASLVPPKFEGSEAQPDMYVSVEMQSFHLAGSEPVDKNTRATMRLIIGKDKNSRDRIFDDVFWTISAGLDLYNQASGQRAKPNDFKSDFSKALGNRPIEVPGGLANITFEVLKHREPKWWQRIFGFLQSEAGRSLTSVVGFPAITQSAIKVLDELFNRFDRNDSEPIFQSRSMILALSQLAKMDYTAGNPRIRMGSLNPGFCVMARGRDYHKIADADAYYYPHYGILVPASVDPGDVVTQNYDDPFKDITYVVFKIGMVPTKLDLRFNYGGRFCIKGVGHGGLMAWRHERIIERESTKVSRTNNRQLIDAKPSGHMVKGFDVDSLW